MSIKEKPGRHIQKAPSVDALHEDLLGNVYSSYGSSCINSFSAYGVAGPGMQPRTEAIKQLCDFMKRKKLTLEHNNFPVHTLVIHGIAMSVADTLKNELDINDEQMAEVLGTSASTILRLRKLRKLLGEVPSDRLVRYARLLEISTEVFEDKQKAASWLKRPQFGLGGKVPLDLMKSETGAREVENLLMRIEHGVLA